MSTYNFTGRVAVVTGAAKGIGAATAQLLAECGATVIAFDIDDAALADRRSAWAKEGLTISTMTVDLRSSSAIDDAFDAIQAEHGRLDVLANVAGIVRYGYIDDDDFTEDDWDAILDTNLKATYLTCRRAVPIMRRSGGGAIVNMASVQAVASQQTVAAYAASKGAVVSFTRSIALDYAADGIRSNCVLPGSVETPMLRQGAETFGGEDPEGTMQQWGAAQPLGFLIQPVDVANLIAFLASDEARVITGAPIIADAGLLAKLGV